MPGLSPRRVLFRRPLSRLRSRSAGVGVAAGVLLLTGCVSSTPRFTMERSATVAHRPDSPVSVESGNGSVTVEASPIDDVRVVAMLRSPSEERVTAARLVAERADDGTLRVRVAWPGGKREPNEGAIVRVELPDARGVTVRTSNAGVRIVGLTGAADLKTSNDSIRVLDHDGLVTARTTNGPIRAEYVSGVLDLSSSNAPITVVDAGGTVDAETSNAGVQITLRDGNAGPVRVRTSNGSVTLDVGSGFTGRLRAETSNGSVMFQNLPEAQVVSADRGSGEAIVGDASSKSTIRTTNGSVRVRGAEPSGGR